MSFTKRLSVPVGVAAIVALIVALSPALLASAGSRLPDVSAKQLLVNMARSDVEGLSGVVETRAELGLPQLPSGQGGGHHGNGVAPRDLLTGTHTLRVAKAGPEKQRVEMLGELAQYTLVHNGRHLWAYDSAQNKAVHWQVPEGAYGKFKQRMAQPETGHPSMTPSELAEHFLDKVGPSTKMSVQGTDQVAGRDAYTLTLAPRAQQSLVGKVQMYVDAETWAPLRVTVTPRGGGDAAIDVGFREVSFGAPPASRFEFTPPEGAEVKQKTVRPHAKNDRPDGSGETDGPDAGRHGERPQAPEQSSPEVIGQGWASVLAFDQATSGKNQRWLGRTGERVSGEFGQGRIVTTRLVTALVTDDGHVYVGAVTPAAIKKAAASS